MRCWIYLLAPVRFRCNNMNARTKIFIGRIRNCTISDTNSDQHTVVPTKWMAKKKNEIKKYETSRRITSNNNKIFLVCTHTHDEPSTISIDTHRERGRKIERKFTSENARKQTHTATQLRLLRPRQRRRLNSQALYGWVEKHSWI